MKKIPKASDYFYKFNGNHRSIGKYRNTAPFYDDRLPKPTPGYYFEHFRDMAIRLLRQAKKIQKPSIFKSFGLSESDKMLFSRILFSIGVEALLKACYLKKGFSINKVSYDSKKVKGIKFPTRMLDITYDKNNKKKPKIKVASFSDMIDNFDKAYTHKEINEIKNWLTIARIWRNMHIHIGYRWGDDYFISREGKQRVASEEILEVLDTIIVDFFGNKYKINK